MKLSADSCRSGRRSAQVLVVLLSTRSLLRAVQAPFWQCGPGRGTGEVMVVEFAKLQTCDANGLAPELRPFPETTRCSRLDAQAWSLQQFCGSRRVLDHPSH